MNLRTVGFCALVLVAGRIGAQSAPPLQARTLARNLETPWSLAFAPDGRLFVAERPGRIRIIRHDSLLAEPWALVPAYESAAESLETGLMGLAIDPDFAKSHRVYVCYTSHQGVRVEENHIAVLTEERGHGVRLTDLVTTIPSGKYHNGCRLKFGPDGKLYASTGDAGGARADGDSAQSRTSLAGKILRLNPDGTIPADNPRSDSYIWSLGHRNGQGLAFRPSDGALFETEHGTGGDGNNELNLIERGKNYGWPIAIGVERDARFTSPIAVWPYAPAGATFVTGACIPELEGSLVVATLSAKRLLRIRVSAGSTPTAETPEILMDSAFGRLRDVVTGPDGCLYVATSNRDGRGRPDAGADRVLRLAKRPRS